MANTKPAAKGDAAEQQAQTKRTGDGHPGDPAAKEQAQSSVPVDAAETEPTPATVEPVMADPNAHPQTVDLKGCARCYANGHPGLTFEPLTYPVVVAEHDAEEGHELEFTHWAPCPTNGQPILLATSELEGEPEPVAPPDTGTA